MTTATASAPPPPRRDGKLAIAASALRLPGAARRVGVMRTVAQHM